MSTNNNSNLNYGLKIFAGSVYTLAYSLIGASVFVILWFALNSYPITAFKLHIILSLLGYQLLMSHGILSVSNYSWSSSLTLLHRHRIHWILQMIASGLAIAGSVIMMREKAVNFTSIHGKLALAAFIITCMSLLNGIMTLYRVRINLIIPAKVLKICHVFLGTAAFVISSVCLSFGYRKKSFVEWATNELSYVMIAMTSAYTIIVVFKPCYTMWRKFSQAMKIKIF